jgi:pterin-4a-carbinolamine dehydratase
MGLLIKETLLCVVNFFMRKAYLSLGLLAAACPLALTAPALQPPTGWQTNGHRLECTYQLANFAESVTFIERLVAPAEALSHHPDVAIAYNRVSLSLTTHDAGGLTNLDLQLAQAIAAIAAQQDPPLHCLPQR